MEKCEDASGTKKAQHLGLARLGLADQQSTKAFFISISISSASFTFSGVQKKSTDSLILPLYFVLKICIIKETNWRSFCWRSQCLLRPGFRLVGNSQFVWLNKCQLISGISRSLILSPHSVRQLNQFQLQFSRCKKKYEMTPHVGEIVSPNWKS